MRRWLLYSNLHIVPVAAGFVLGSYALAGVPADAAYVVLAACGAFLVYQWDRVSGFSPEDEINVPERRDWLVDRPVYLVLSSLVALSGAVWALTVSSNLVRLSAAILGMLGAGYAVPFFFGRRPKDLSRIRNLLVAGCWIGGGVLLPLLDASADSTRAWLLCAYRFAYIIPDMTVAEVADRPGDIAVGLKESLPAGSLSPYRITLGASVVAAGLGVALLWAGGIGEFRSTASRAILLMVDLVGIVGTVWSVRRLTGFEYRHVIILDAWVAFPLVTWIVSRLL